jgi:hypothetical protein
MHSARMAKRALPPQSLQIQNNNWGQLIPQFIGHYSRLRLTIPARGVRNPLVPPPSLQHFLAPPTSSHRLARLTEHPLVH